MKYVPYTYLIGWSDADVWYYGSQYSQSKKKIANPKNLWVSYFTSSEEVKSYRKLHGDPDIIKVRQTFETAEEARSWEARFLRKVKAVESDRWLNKSYGDSKFLCLKHSEETKAKIRESCKGINKGKKHPHLSEWNRSGITLEQRKKGIETKRRNNSHRNNKGYKHTPEAIQKMKESSKDYLRGKTYEEIHGVEKALELKAKRRATALKRWNKSI